jgi:hypothetical protein
MALSLQFRWFCVCANPSSKDLDAPRKSPNLSPRAVPAVAVALRAPPGIVINSAAVPGHPLTFTLTVRCKHFAQPMSMGLLRFRSTETIGAMTHPNIELLRRAWAAYDRGDIEAFAACLTDDRRESGPSRA